MKTFATQRPVLSFLLCTAAIVAALAASPVMAQDAVVPTDFATIQAAVQSATDVDLNGTIEIQVLAGTYNEAILVLRDDISLIGEGAATTIIDGGNPPDVIRVDRADRFSLQGFTVTSIGESDGVDLNRSNNSSIVGNVVTNCRDGIRVDRSNGVLIESNEAASNNSSGIKVTRSQGAIVMLNSVHDNRSAGIDIRGVASTQVDDNLVENNLGNGIRIRRTDGANSVMGNTIPGSFDDGMEIREATSTMVLNNTITGGFDNGFRLRETSQSLFAGNVVTGNVGFGVRMRDAVDDDWDDTVAGTQPPAGNNDLSGNGSGEIRID